MTGTLILVACGSDDDDGESADEGSEEGDGHGDHDVPADLANAGRDDRCDIRFNTATFNETAEVGTPHVHSDDGSGVDFTVEEWAEIFVDPDHPMSDGVPTDVAVDVIKNSPWMEAGILSGGIAHELVPDPWLPTVDHEECTQLAEELAISRSVAEAYPTAQDAIDGGYGLVTPFYPGIAAHYMKNDIVDDVFDFEEPEMLLYDGDSPEANIVGVSHYMLGDEAEPPDEGFSSPNHHWHKHATLCFVPGEGIRGGSNMTEEECADIGGFLTEGQDQWMNHVWIVPGCESDWGLFSAANPNIVSRFGQVDEAPETGCGTGKAIDGELDFDDGGHGPEL
jgi:hypothetical protein